MKIKSLRSWKEDLDLTRPYTIAYQTISAVENLFVEVELENGIIGIGAGSPAKMITGEDLDNSFQELQQSLPKLIQGQDIRHFYMLMHRLSDHFAKAPAALAAVDIALHDAFTQMLGVPLVSFLGKAHDKLPTSITIGIKSLQESIEEAKEYRDRGFRVIKLKTGNQVDKDIEIFREIRATVGPEIKIRVDANQGYDIIKLNQFVEATRSLGLEFIEQPLPVGKKEQLRTLPDALRSICCADEDLHSPMQAAQLSARPHAYGIYNIKLMKCGGIHKAIQIANIAHENKIELMWGCMDESIVSIAAALHAAFASPATRYIDLDGSLDLAKDLVEGGFILEDGFMQLTPNAGLGVQRLHQQKK